VSDAGDAVPGEESFPAGFIEGEADASEQLFHYTNSAGLMGILKDRAMIATHSSFVNDEKEMSHGLSVARSIYQERSAGGEPFVESVLRLIDGFDGSPPEEFFPYIACFSEERDQLSQWRGYGSDEGAVSIGFSVGGIARALERWAIQDRAGVRLLQVLYKPTEQNRLLDDLFQKPMTTDRMLVGSAGVMTRERFYRALVRCKHKGFEEEKEWRIAADSINGLGTRGRRPDGFRRRGRYIAPHVKIALAPTDGLLPLTQITCAPGDTGGIAAAGVRSILNFYGYTDVPVQESETPYRN
jgi:Protein of unknown function (DUF2971)